MTDLEVTRPTPAARDLVSADPQRWLPGPARPAGPDRWMVTLRAGPFRRAALVEVGSCRHEPDRCGRALRWHTDPEPGDVLPFEILLPAFEGELVADDRGLTLRGSYEPPAGVVGRVADVALSRIARRTLRRLLDEIAAQGPGTGTEG